MRLAVLLLLVTGTAGCAALHPIHGVPASYLPPEFLGPSRDGLRPINPMLLTRSRPPEHLVDSGDVLSIYIPGVLGTATTDATVIGEIPPINLPTDPEMPPTIGFPITVRGDGTISLPQVSPIPVRGLTLAQVEAAVRQAYTHPRQILPVGKERLLVSLQRPREYRVLVVREDTSPSAEITGIGSINIGNSRRGTARIVSLKAYENDVLHALARQPGADGLPGLDAEGAVYVIRRQARSGGGYGMPQGAGPEPGGWGGAAGWGAPHPMGQPIPSPGGPTVIRGQSPELYARSNAALNAGHSVTSLSSGGAYGVPTTRGPSPTLTGTGRHAAASPAWNSPGRGAASAGTSPTATGRAPTTAAGSTGHAAFMATPATAAAGTTPIPRALGAPQAMQPPAAMIRPVAYQVSPGVQPAPPATNSVQGSPVQNLPPQGSPLQSVPAPNMASPHLPGRSYPLAPPTLNAPTPVWSGPMPGTVQTPPAGSPEMNVTGPELAPMPDWRGGVSPLPAPGAMPMHEAVPPGMPRFPGDGLDPAFEDVYLNGLQGTIDDPSVIRIPIRVGPGETPMIRECDIILEDGDIVFIEARHSEVFYTGGLLGGGQYTLPRDYDLNALEALSIAQSPSARGGAGGGGTRSSGGVSGLNQDVTISASRLIVVRKLPNGTRVPIEIDLHRAKRDMTGRENIIIQPGDYLYLQYTCLEAVGAFFERHLLEGALFGVASAQLTTSGR